VGIANAKNRLPAPFAEAGKPQKKGPAREGRP
jgi:hypothetical protein